MFKMKDIINHLVSEKVMGWHLETLPNNEENPSYYAIFWVDKDGVQQKPANFWSPATDLKDAWTLIETLRKERGILVSVQTGENDYTSTYNGNKGTVSTSESLAISIASLKAVGVDIADVYSKVDQLNR